jgi:hypothetical protein
MPLPTTFAGVSARGEGQFRQLSIPNVYWINGTKVGSYTYNVASGGADSLGNTYFVMYYNTGTNIIVKYNSSGILQWQVSIPDSSLGYFGAFSDSSLVNMRVTSSGNVYVSLYRGGSGNYGIFKINSSGVGQWWREHTAGFIFDIAVDSSENVYTSYSDNSNGSPTVSSLTSTLSPYWNTQTPLPASPTGSGNGGMLSNVAGNTIVRAGDGNTFNTSAYRRVTHNFTPFLQSFNATTGALNWNVYEASLAGENAAYLSPIIDSSGNVTFVKLDPTAGSLALIQLNSSGALNWNSVYESGGLPVNGRNLQKCLTNDSLGNFYCIGFGNSASGVAKFNSSGTLLWTYTLGSNWQPNGLFCDSQDNLYIYGATSGYSSNIGFIYKVPTDGSHTFSGVTLNGNAASWSSTSVSTYGNVVSMAIFISSVTTGTNSWGTTVMSPTFPSATTSEQVTNYYQTV